ncbi:hypothetical protein ACFL3D_05975 [Candidatus Omnitrophota bacterium]
MVVNPISSYYGALLFRPTTQTKRPSQNEQEEFNLKLLDQTEQSVTKLQKNYLKAVT